MSRTRIRLARAKDIDSIKELFDRHRTELGFVLRPSLTKSIELGEVFVATYARQVIGAVHFHHRRDGQTTLYHIAVDLPHRSQHIGTTLLKRLQTACAERGMTHILLKCPVDLPSNKFYEHVGFRCRTRETGKNRDLNVWIAELNPANTFHL